MSVLEFTEVVASQLIFDDSSDMSPEEHDPDTATPSSSQEVQNGNKTKKMHEYYHCFKYTKLSGSIIRHYLIKSPIRETKNGKRYHKTNNCYVCRESGIRRQTTFQCSKCNIPLCYPSFTERSNAPTDCFHKYHEKTQIKHMFTYESSDDDSQSTGTNDSKDDLIDMTDSFVDI